MSDTVEGEEVTVEEPVHDAVVLARENNNLPQLPMSALSIEPPFLIKRSIDTVVAQHPLSEILSIEIEDGWDGCMVGLAVGAALAALSGTVVLSSPWQWIAAVLFGGVILIAAASSRKKVLHIASTHGDFSYSLTDSPEDSVGFVASLRSYVENAREEEKKRLRW